MSILPAYAFGLPVETGADGELIVFGVEGSVAVGRKEEVVEMRAHLCYQAFDSNGFGCGPPKKISEVVVVVNYIALSSGVGDV